MPVQTLLSLLLCIPAFCGGLLLARRVVARKLRADQKSLETRMARNASSRFSAFMRLEAKMTRILARLNQMQQAAAESPAEDSGTRAAPQREVAATAGETPAPAAQLHSHDPESGLGWMKAFLDESAHAAARLAHTGVTPSPLAPVGRTASAAGESSLKQLCADKQAEIGRQTVQIAQLNERLSRLEPGNDLTGRLEQELLLWQDKHQRLERENAIEIAGLRARADEGKKSAAKLAQAEAQLGEWQTNHDALRAAKDAEIAQLQSRVGELEPSVAAAQAARKEVGEWQARCKDEVARRESEVGELRERVDELEPMESTIEFLWEDKAALERTISGKDRSLEEAEGRRKQLALELTAAQESLRDLETSHRELIGSHSAELAALRGRLAELEPMGLRLEDAGTRITELEDQTRGSRARVTELEQQSNQYKGRAEEQEAEALRWKHASEEAGSLAASWEERYRKFESDKLAEILSLQAHAKMLEPLVSRVANFERLVIELETKDRDARSRITQLEVESRRLTRELEARTFKHDRTSERLADVEKSLVESTERLRQSEEQHSSELTDLQGRVQKYASELAQSQALQAQLDCQRRERDGRIHELEQDLKEHMVRSDALQQQFEALQSDAHGKGHRIQTLMAELDQSTQESERMRRESAKKHSLVQAAESVLAELRPKLQALEAQLHDRPADAD